MLEYEDNIHILLVDDDTGLQSGLRDFLKNYGCQVSLLSDGKNIEEHVKELTPDIMLLDVMLPGDDGFTVLQKVRNVSSMPVIMLTARGSDSDRIVGLEMGADDYIPKPFNPRELFARVKAVLRRFKAQKEGVETQLTGQVSVGKVTLDCKAQTLNGPLASVDLSTTEFRIVHAFMSNAGNVLSRDQVLNLAFGKDYYANDRNIDVYISRIRGILKKIGEEPSIIRTVWGSGYCWIGED